jgi:hypothetical protein
MYRDFDGQGGRFGDRSLPAKTSSIADTAIYASTFDADPTRVVLVAINRSSSDHAAEVRVIHRRALSSGQVWRLTADSTTPARDDDLTIVPRNAFRLALPKMSVSTVLLSTAD